MSKEKWKEVSFDLLEDGEYKVAWEVSNCLLDNGFYVIPPDKFLYFRKYGVVRRIFIDSTNEKKVRVEVTFY